MPTGSALLHQIDRLPGPPDALAVWFLGQAGLILKGADTVVYIDPYLTGEANPADAPPAPSRRMFPPPLAPESVTNADVVLLTHDHLDHTDAATVGPLAKASPQAVFVGSSWSRAILKAAGVSDDRVRPAPVGEPLTFGALTVTPIPAAHYDLERDGAGHHRYLGYLVSLNGVTLYHSGDTILVPELLDALERQRVDIAALPVNGRDYWRDQRNIVGNLYPQEAANVVATIGADVFIPLHNDLFAGNRLSPAMLAEDMDRRYPRQKYHWLQPGELFFYAR